MISHCEFKKNIFNFLFQFRIKYIQNNLKYFLGNIYAFIGTYNQTLQLKSPLTQPISHHPNLCDPTPTSAHPLENLYDD